MESTVGEYLIMENTMGEMEQEGKKLPMYNYVAKEFEADFVNN